MLEFDADDILLDCRGLICPLPVLRARKKLLSLPPGSVLGLLATDAAALRDIPLFCSQTGHQMLDSGSDGGEHRFRIRRAG